MADPGLDFDRATYTSGDSRAPCASCRRPLVDAYWQWQGHLVCASCRDGVAATLERARTGSSMARAALFGGVAALGCGVAYAVFVGLTHVPLALATIGIAYVVARVVRKVSGLGGRRFQVLAVALTYAASTMGYLPSILGEVSRVPLASLPLLLGITLAAPFLEITTAPLGALIVLFGLWEAWKLSRGVPARILGPFRVASPSASIPGT